MLHKSCSKNLAVKPVVCSFLRNAWNTEQRELTSRRSNSEWALQFPLFLQSDAPSTRVGVCVYPSLASCCSHILCEKITSFDDLFSTAAEEMPIYVKMTQKKSWKCVFGEFTFSIHIKLPVIN